MVRLDCAQGHEESRFHLCGQSFSATRSCFACWPIPRGRRHALLTKPADERRDLRWREVREAHTLGEVLEDVGVKLAFVFVARALPEAASAAALVALDPLVCVLVERDAGALLPENEKCSRRVTFRHVAAAKALGPLPLNGEVRGRTFETQLILRRAAAFPTLQLK